MTNKNFTFSFLSKRKPIDIYNFLLTVDQWWIGLYNEVVIGNYKNVGDEFTFNAGGGAHYSKQHLVELIPLKKILWLVTESHLSFLAKKDEWNNTKFGFDISDEEGQTKVQFTHEGLIPMIECYDSCSNAWTQYLKNLEFKLG